MSSNVYRYKVGRTFLRACIPGDRYQGRNLYNIRGGGMVYPSSRRFLWYPGLSRALLLKTQVKCANFHAHFWGNTSVYTCCLHKQGVLYIYAVKGVTGV